MKKFLRKLRNVIFRAKYTSEATPGIEAKSPQLLGSLSEKQLHAVLKSLPIDLSFVDERGLNRFVLLGREPVFSRDEGIIGMPVEDCHNEKSRVMVKQILDDFKSGRQSICDFWMTYENRFIHIYYIAVRDDSGKYQGCLEFVYDATRTRKLDGARHELIYDMD